VDIEAEHFKTHEVSLMQTETGLLDETADIDSLRSAYWAVVGQSKRRDFPPESTQFSPVNFISPGIFNTPSAHQGLYNIRTKRATSYPYSKPHDVKLCKPLKLVLGITGLGITCWSVYMACNIWYISCSTELQAYEPVNLLNFQDSEIINIKHLQKNSNEETPNTSLRKSKLLAQVSPMGNGPLKQAVEQLPGESEPIGRADPFAPLVSLEPVIDSNPNVKVDVFANLQYTGFIGDINATERMAIIKVSDPVSGTAKTIIKKEGESWLLFGEMVTVKSISKNNIYLNAQGEHRQLQLKPFQTAKATPKPDGNIKNTSSVPIQNSGDSEGDDHENEYP